jgi:transposase
VAAAGEATGGALVKLSSAVSSLARTKTARDILEALAAGERTGQVFASTPKTTGIVPFMGLMGEVMARPEYKNAPRVLVVVDNGSDHRGRKAADRLRKAHPNAIMIHTPVHASWLNQVEIVFSVIQKKAISPNDFPSLDKLSETLLAFIGRYNQTARPFSWKYTADDLKDLIRRITEHEKRDVTGQSGLAIAA